MKYLLIALCAIIMLSCQKRDYPFAPAEKHKLQVVGDYVFSSCGCGGFTIFQLDSSGVIIGEVKK